MRSCSRENSFVRGSFFVGFGEQKRGDAMAKRYAPESRTCTIYDTNSPTGQCPKPWFCRGRCQPHYMSLRRAELEGRAEKLQQQEPQRPKWEWPGDEQFLIDRLEAAEKGIEDQQELQVSD